MKTKTCILWLAVITGLLIHPPTLRAELATVDDARIVAENYVKHVIARDGSWGAHASARIGTIAPFGRGDTLLGYFCPVEPEGWFVLGLYRELAPIRGYSTEGHLDPEQKLGMTDLLKDRMATLYASVEQVLGRPIDPREDFSAILPAEFRGVWATLSDPAFVPSPGGTGEKTRSAGMNYQMGDVLLHPDTAWTQRPPYNQQCPDGGCDWNGWCPGYTGTNVRVGCGGTAGAMILKYWNWPPYGSGSIYADSYDWKNMHVAHRWDEINLRFEKLADGVWYPAAQVELDAVAEVSYEFANALPSDWGCEGTSSYLEDADNAFEDHFRFYHQTEIKHADDFTFSEYWSRLTNEFDLNRPVYYYIPGHFIVGDGYNEEWINDPTYGYQYYWLHINYGWGGTHTGWCPPQEIPDSSYSDEAFIRYILPEVIFGEILNEDYALDTSFPYRYFYIDAEGWNASVAAGHYLQILKPGFLLTTLLAAETVFHGAPEQTTRFFLNGDPFGETRIKIHDGQLKVMDGGQLAIY